MVIFLNLDGTAENVTPQHVYQGSNNVTDITVVAPFPATTAMQIGFILPTGLYWQSAENSRYAPMEFVEQDTVNGVAVWHYLLPRSVTSSPGVLQIAINAVTANGNTTSYLCEQIIEESVLPNLPAVPTQSVYDLILLYLARLDNRTIGIPNLVKSIQKVAPNAFTYTTNNGVVSAPIVIEGGDTAPLPVNTASVITVQESAWEAVYSGASITGYTVLISAGQHGQMRDGATANDLWVSFDEADGTGFLGAFKRYTVDDSGNITIYANQPVTTTVRVWNGKSIVDVEARTLIADETERAESAEQAIRDLIAAETQRAESAEENLQTQITELQNTGVDTVARQEIAALTDRVQSLEDNSLAFDTTEWSDTAESMAYLGAVSKTVTLPSGKHIAQVLDENNQPRGTWQGNTIYANYAFAGVAIIL